MIVSRNCVAVHGGSGQTGSVDTRRPCPCCGHLVFNAEDGWPGSYAICPVCFWEDDLVQFRWPTMAGGANRIPLVEAQQNFQSYGACDQRGRRFVRPATPDERVDPEWRPIDLARDLFEDWESDGRRPWPEDKLLLCWWLPSFWGRPDDAEVAVPERVLTDVSAVETVRELHGVLKEALGFPAFYGMNWDAFWDAITGLVQMPDELVFTGWTELERRLPAAASSLQDRLAKYGQETSDFKASFGL
jgi:RNAse (barnase) inhibitor barstar